VKRLIVTVLMLLLLPVPVKAADPPLPTDPLAIRNELRSLRKKTADNDKKVRARIDALMKQLQKLQAQRDAAESQARGEAKPEDDDDKAVMTREAMWDKVQETAAKGKVAKLDLAEPVREKVTEEYKEDRDTSIRNPTYYQEARVLIIDLSRKEAQVLIDLLDKFSGITTLILTGGVNGAQVNLDLILKRARHLPLNELYIFNFRGFVSSIPDSISTFEGLTTLSLFNNTIRTLPSAVGKLQQLRTLHVDINPISSLFPAVKELSFLEEIGVAKTNISAAELQQLAELLPNCKVVTE
jgi:ethanolamine utilization microcompartment shell protein EutS